MDKFAPSTLKGKGKLGIELQLEETGHLPAGSTTSFGQLSQGITETSPNGGRTSPNGGRTSSTVRETFQQKERDTTNLA